MWFELNIAETGQLAFTIEPNSNAISVDYDFYIFGPNPECGSLNNPIRCSTTNPEAAALNTNHTGLRNGESDTSEGPGADGNSFLAPLSVTAGERYLLLVNRPHGNGGFDLNWSGNSLFNDPPEILGEPDPLDFCMAYAGMEVDLTQNNHQISADPSFAPSFFTSYANAFDATNAISNPSAFIWEQTGNQTIYIRINAENGCFEILELPINAQTFISQVFAYNKCDLNHNGRENFDLNQIALDIGDALTDASLFQIQLLSDYIAAENDLTPLAQPSVDTGAATLYARISAQSDPSCFTILPISLMVIESPVPAGAELRQCDVDPNNSTDGITQSDLNQIFKGLLEPGITYDFYTSDADRNLGNAIDQPQNFSNTQAFDQTIYYRVYLNQCSLDGEFNLSVAPTTVSLNPVSPFYACAENPSEPEAQATFDLEEIRTLNYPNLETAFYTSLHDLSLEQHEITGNYYSSSRTVYVRIEEANQCQGVEEFELRVNQTPLPQIPEEVILCTDNPPLPLKAPVGYDIYRWHSASGELISENAEVELNATGDYTLEVGYRYDQNNTFTYCTSFTDFKVVGSNQALIQDIEVSDLTENNTLSVSVAGDGEYLYSLDGITYQNEPYFEGLEAGIHRLYIQDQLGCGIRKKDVAIIGYPKFFTPNSDNHNDLWKLYGVNEEFNADAAIYIFNRYGALVAEVRPESDGWNGTVNGTPLPASDYWFKLQLPNGRIHTGHFSLKR
jgi:gliding motility-associated-like protein